MTTTTSATSTSPSGTDPNAYARILGEGYGSGAWHGPDLATALSDVTRETAFRRVSAGRHNIAEIALHHAWCIRSVTAQLTGREPRAFPLAGEDWFDVEGATKPSWKEVRAILADYQEKLSQATADIAAGRIASPLNESERFGLVLGVTCHAVYHAGQVQLLKRLLAVSS
jgi:hypothetical protein